MRSAVVKIPDEVLYDIKKIEAGIMALILYTYNHISIE